MVIYSGFTHWKWWFSIVMLVYQRVNHHSVTQKQRHGPWDFSIASAMIKNPIKKNVKQTSHGSLLPYQKMSKKTSHGSLFPYQKICKDPAKEWFFPIKKMSKNPAMEARCQTLLCHGDVSLESLLGRLGGLCGAGNGGMAAKMGGVQQ